jgi:hypothetical protein
VRACVSIEREMPASSVELNANVGPLHSHLACSASL